MQTVVRVAAAYLLLLIAFRVLGKRELRKMSAFELVTLLFIPQLFSRALTRQDYSFTNAVVGASTLLTLGWLSSAISYRFKGVARLLKGEPTVLVAHGALIPDAMDRERITAGELFSELHRVGLVELAQVRWAILETSGTITVIPTPDARTYVGNYEVEAGAQGF
ncbi:MAG TPA: YetF domain-containing protein [Gemmatimonadaceae bacterium]